MNKQVTADRMVIMCPEHVIHDDSALLEQHLSILVHKVLERIDGKFTGMRIT